MSYTGRSRLLLVALFGFVLFGPGTRSAEANCGFAQFEMHLIGSWFENCPDTTPVSASAFLLSNPLAVNSGGRDIVCRDGRSLTSQLIPCQPEAGTVGDAHVTVQFDWGGLYTGPYDVCPNPEGIAGETYRTMVHLVEGNGRSILVSVNYQLDMATYVLDWAHPYDASADLFSPLSCGDPGRVVLHLDQLTVANGSIQTSVTMSAPTIASDCDPGTAGALFGSCASGPATLPAPTLGRIYTKTLPCGGLTDLRTTGWSFQAVPDAQGSAAVSFPAPAEGLCVYIGATYRMNGTEIPVIAGALRIPPDDCGPDGCAPGDGDIRVSLTNSTGLQWQEGQTFSSFNVYRGDVAELRRSGAVTQDPATEPLAARACGVAGDNLVDNVALAPGQAVFFHVTGNDASGESRLGLDSFGQPRSNSNPCP